jgi:hypothetical protein
MAIKRSRPPRTLLEVDDALVGLARAVERHARMLAGHDQQVRETAALVERVATGLAEVRQSLAQHRGVEGQDEGPTGPGAGGSAPGPEDGGLPSWLVVTDWHQAEALMSVLAPWVEQVYLRWPDAPLASCWALHPHAVEELWTLRCCWWYARTGEDQSWLKWQDWHDRQRPAVARRLREALEGCSLLDHATPDRSAHPVLPGSDTLPQVVTSWATDQHEGWPPSLNDTQLAQERQRQAEQARVEREAQASDPRVPRRSLSE